MWNFRKDEAMNKIATTLEQSRKLAEILPTETADMSYFREGFLLTSEYVKTKESMLGHYSNQDEKLNIVPAWSLSALLKVLPYDITMVEYQTIFDRPIVYYIESDLKESISYKCMEKEYERKKDSPEEIFFTSGETLLDAAYALIFKLHEWFCKEAHDFSGG